MVVGSGGLAEVYALGRLHPVNRVRSLEDKVDRINRALVYAYRGHRRIRLNDPDGLELAHSDHEGEYLFTSEDGSLVLSDGTTYTTRRNVVDFAVAAPGCTVSWDKITPQNGDAISTDSCGEDIAYRGYDTQQVIRVETHGVEGGDADTLADQITSTYVDTVLTIAGYVWIRTDNAGWKPVLIGADPGGGDPDPGTPPGG